MVLPAPKTVRVVDVTPDLLRQAYEALPAGGVVEVPCGPETAAGVLAALERAGFAGMRLDADAARAVKGKQGPCFDTGRTAAYVGSALAALDDDAHLLFGRMRLCEKTARVYGSAVYEGRVDVSGADPALLARLETDPAPFDCDTFEADAKALSERLPGGGPAVGERATVLYPGPFRLLVLDDGSIVRRGRPAGVVRPLAEALVKRDGARILDGPAEPAEDFGAGYRMKGPICLFGAGPGGGPAPPAAEADLKAVVEAPPALRRRLEALVDRGDGYFVLVGSDPSDRDGCCPSDDVGAANALVRAGVLGSWTSSASSSCPATVYAFAGELAPGGDQPVFSRNERLRRRVRDTIKSGEGIASRVAVRLVLWAIGLASAAALAWTVLRTLGVL